ncbi:hypothetical protein CBW65_06765 [Tumebacillus avium]|uniref:Carrier domain-containing protein n=1 Tax=Tumebacillus avium TaxID=1903704 RepID=A0A1Y0IK26_9BACL|nr:non-ribosomal peptide synthetase [Tumebacillus avium]ARU60828.1 hypothetical protein CBW65_06765 [Tumebacillus avium]
MLIGRLNKTFKKQIPLRTIFEHPTIAELAAVIGGTESGGAAAIPAAPKRDLYPASSAQKRMYVLHRLKADDLSYNITGVMDLSGPLDASRFERAAQALVWRHEALRTSFVMADGEVMQKVAERPAFAVAQRAADEDELDVILHSFIRPFDLARGPLLRVGLITLGPERHVLIFDMHHIIADGVSMGVLVEEFAALYGGAELPELTLHYKDYAVWQQERAASETHRAQEAYWLNKFAGELPTLDLPTDAPRPAVKSFSGGQVAFGVDAELTAKLRRLMAETDTTLFMVLLAIYSVWLAKYAGQEDVVVGTPVAGRPHADLEKMVGLFLNTLPLRSYPQPNKSFRAYLAEIKQLALEAFEHQAYPFEELVDKLALPRDLSRNPLFDAMLVLQPLDLAAISTGGITFTPREADLGRAKLDLSLHAVEQERGIGLKLEYAGDLFARATAERMAAHFLLLLQAAVSAPQAELAKLRMLSSAEEQQVLLKFNDTAVLPRQAAGTVAQRFEEQAEKTPEAIAVVSAEETLTYAELNRRANQLARRLKERGAVPNSFVAIMVDRSAAVVTAILAVLKSGAAYVPIDPELPVERIRFTLADSGASVLLTQKQLIADLEFAGELLLIEDETLYQGDDFNLPVQNVPGDAVYAIYTSGTTGRPKGVVIEHHSLLNYADWLVQAGGVSAADKTALLASYSFDLGYTALYPALLTGAELHILAQEHYADPALLLAYLQERQITFIKATPTLFGMLVSAPGLAKSGAPTDLRLVVLGGERLNVEDVQAFHRHVPSAQVMNHYGPTETTVGAVAQLIDWDDHSSFTVIGKPIHNAQVYLLDALGHPVPVGVRGEIHIAGAGVARGYLNSPELEAEKFIPNRFGAGRLYKTGDVGRQLPDGRIQFLGRTDEQVKIRGYRVEPAEIEQALLAQEGIREAAVIAQKNRHGSYDLCAYVTGEEQLQPDELRARLARLLPSYLLPAYYARLERLPVTPNGKLDKKALPTLPLPDGAGKLEQQTPGTALEQQLALIWQEVLGVEHPGLDGDFFALGGNSLKATVLTARIEKELHAQLSLRHVFQTPTIRGLAQQLQAANGRFRPIQPAPKGAHYPVSSAQKRLLIISQLDAEGVTYNMPGGFLLDGHLDTARFAEALQALTQRHETLRTSFAWVDGEPVQQIAPDVTLPLLYSEGIAADDDQIEAAARAFLRPFDLAQAPLMRAGLIKLAEQRHLFLYDMHHAIADGVSRRLLVQELAALYAGESLPPLPLQFKDYVLWQQEMEASSERERQERFWLEAFAGEVPVLQLPTDFPRPPVKSYGGARSSALYDEALATGLKRLAEDSGATLFMVLLTAYQILLAKHAGQEDVVVGTPIAGRAHADADGLIGMFVNTLPLRGRPQAAKTIGEYLAEVRELSLQALEHGDYPFEKLAGALQVRVDRSRNPLFDAMFVWDNLGNRSLTMEGLLVTPYVLEDDTAKFDITLYAEEQGGGLRVMFEYATALFRPQTAERLQADLETILRAMVQDQTQTIGGIELAAGYQTAANGLDDDADFLF